MLKNIKIPPQLFAYGLITLIVVWVLYLIMRRTGLIQSKEARAASKEKAAEEAQIKLEKQLLEDSEYFNPNLYKKTGYNLSVILPEDSAKLYAKQIFNAWGIINDDEEQVYDVFRKIPNKITISQVSDMYSKMYKADLLGELIYRMSKTELAFIYRIIDKKPIK